MVPADNFPANVCSKKYYRRSLAFFGFIEAGIFRPDGMAVMKAT
jgi:hypothetical protein